MRKPSRSRCTCWPMLVCLLVTSAFGSRVHDGKEIASGFGLQQQAALKQYLKQHYADGGRGLIPWRRSKGSKGSKSRLDAQVAIAALEPSQSDHRGQPQVDHRGPGHKKKHRTEHRSSWRAELHANTLEDVQHRSKGSSDSTLGSRIRRHELPGNSNHRSEVLTDHPEQQPQVPVEMPHPAEDVEHSLTTGFGEISTQVDSKHGSSSGRLTEFKKVLTIYYEGAAHDSEKSVQASLAAANVQLSLTASSPSFDNAPKAAPDGQWGYWGIMVDQEVPLLPDDQLQPYITIQGNASYPTKVIMRGRLSSLLSTLMSDMAGTNPSTRTAVQGNPPSSFLSSNSLTLNMPTCEYSGPCNWAVQPNFGPLLGKLTLSPALDGSYSINDIIERRWLPNQTVEVVCEIRRGQEEIVDCPITGQDGSGTDPAV